MKRHICLYTWCISSWKSQVLSIVCTCHAKHVIYKLFHVKSILVEIQFIFCFRDLSFNLLLDIYFGAPYILFCVKHQKPAIIYDDNDTSVLMYKWLELFASSQFYHYPMLKFIQSDGTHICGWCSRTYFILVQTLSSGKDTGWQASNSCRSGEIGCHIIPVTSFLCCITVSYIIALLLYCIIVLLHYCNTAL